MLKLSVHENFQNTAQLCLKSGFIRRVSHLRPAVIDITGRFQPERARVEAFIRGVYARSYDAEISVNYPTLMSVRDEGGEILAALGFRYAAEEGLFLENYTGAPVDELLSVERQRICEIGNLASAGGGASIFLFAALASYLNAKNIEFATVTGTDYLHGYLKKLGLRPKVLCDASLEAVQSDGQEWGRYYDTNPRVLAGSVPHGVARLKKALGAEYHDRRPSLYTRLHYKGGL